MKYKKLVPVCAVLIVLLLSVVLVEGVVRYGLLNPNLVKNHFSSRFVEIARQYYARQRRLAQLEPGLGCYDSEVFYTLCPGKHTLSNIEFTNDFSVNSQGLRDTEENLHSPQVIVLGDSFTMGHGVDQNQIYPQLIASKTGLKVLNAGISSYGTARELLMLNRLDTSALETLIIQYAPNDKFENSIFHEHKGVLPIRTEEYFSQVQGLQASPTSHYFTLLLFKKIFRGFLEQQAAEYENATATAPVEKLFLYAFEKAPKLDLSKVNVILFEAPLGTPAGSELIPVLQKEMQSLGLETKYPRLKILDIAAKLHFDHYYDLDDHWNYLGHETVAQELISALQGTQKQARVD